MISVCIINLTPPPSERVPYIQWDLFINLLCLIICIGLEDWNDADVLTEVLAASQQEYLDSLKHQKSTEGSGSEQCQVENHYCTQQQIENLVQCKRETNVSSSASSPSKSRHKANANSNTEESIELLPAQTLNSLKVETNQDDNIQNQDVKTTDSALSSTAPFGTDIIRSTSKLNENIVPSDGPKLPSPVNEDCDKRRSPSRSPTEDTS